MKKEIYITFIAILFSSSVISYSSLKIKGRLSEEKEFFDKISHLEKMKFANTRFKVAVNFFGQYTKTVRRDDHSVDICFKSSNKSDKSIIVLMESGFGELLGFELFRDGGNYKNLSKCNIGKRIIRDLKFSKGLLFLNMDREKINNMLGMDDYINKGSFSELNYSRHYNEYDPWFDHYHKIKIKFDENNKIEWIYITKLSVG